MLGPRRHVVTRAPAPLPVLALVVVVVGACVPKTTGAPDSAEGSVTVTVAGPPPSFAGDWSLEARQRPTYFGRQYESGLGMDFQPPSSQSESKPTLVVHVDIPSGSYDGNGTYPCGQGTGALCHVSVEHAADGSALPGIWDQGTDPAAAAQCQVVVGTDGPGGFLGNVGCQGLVFDGSLAAQFPYRYDAASPDREATVDFTAVWAFPSRVSYHAQKPPQ